MLSCDQQSCARRKGRGFTLLELLVVLVIISVLTSMVALSVAPTSPTSQRESRRFYQVLEAARQQAVLFNQDLGVEFTDNSYRVLHWRAQQWWLSDTPDFLQHEVPENLFQTLWINGLENENEPGEDDNPQPQVLLLATGEVTPFEWTLQGQADNHQWRLSASPVGEIDLQRESLQ